MVCEVWILLGDVGLERGQLRVSGVPDFLSTDRMTPQHVADARIREHLGQRLLKKFQLAGPGAQPFFTLGFVMAVMSWSPCCARASMCWPLIMPRSPTKVIAWTPNRL